ncbi:late embryogenesis abundant protein At1g64065-like [Durio zibethinus]|uniref:Late embryogenesis abundant protein At1g64065-like n=1 Tax=Durio zibethinus TaxID=66656 RepID=A0A6P5WPN2_DURZI|nr:late embryogenesis abundant protein At1g64065-like [Durio zibethinus]
MKFGDQTSRRKRNIKCWACIVAGVIAQTIIILLFVLLVMRIRNPKVRLEGVIVENVRLDSSPSKPSFTMKLNAQVAVKNTNFGHFKFKNSTFTVSYKGTPVGEATIVKARARARSTKKFNVTVLVSSNNKISRDSNQISSDIDSGIINLSSHAKLEGKIHLFRIFKKKKSTEMNCTMDVNTTLKQIQNLTCK